MYPDTLLAKMLMRNVDSTKDKDGNFYFDRNGDLFNFVLDFYRIGKIVYPSLVTKGDFHQELEFWGIDFPVLNKPDLRDVIDMDRLILEILRCQSMIIGDKNAYGYSYFEVKLSILSDVSHLLALADFQDPDNMAVTINSHSDITAAVATVEFLNCILYYGQFKIIVNETTKEDAKKNPLSRYKENGKYHYRRIKLDLRGNS